MMLLTTLRGELFKELFLARVEFGWGLHDDPHILIARGATPQIRQALPS
jgi:hypothetical protein